MSTEKKTINYNGMELECIDSGYWRDGVTLVRGDEIDEMTECELKAICLYENVAMYSDKETSAYWKYWAILPPKPAPRRLTRREVYALWRKGWDYRSASGRVLEPSYMDVDKDELKQQGSRLRAPNTDEWLEPTSDLLERDV